MKKEFKYSIIIPAQRISGEIIAQSESQVWEVLNEKVQNMNALTVQVRELIVTPIIEPTKA